MENNFRNWFHQPDLQPPDYNMLNSPFNLSQPNTHPAPMRAGSDAFSRGEILPESSGIPNFRGYQTPNPPHGWFYCLPRFRQNFNFVPNSTLKKEIPVSSSANPEAVSTNGKKFIVFDQSGGQTTVLYSSEFRTPVPCLTSLGANINGANDVGNNVELESRRDARLYPGPIIANESDDNQREDSGTEMHEDTDEINALLYSSDEEEDEYSENEEEASTGHSPCVITTNDEQEFYDEIGEEVASSFGPSKRMKLMDEAYASSGENCQKLFDNEEDAQSSCGDGENGKRSRKEKIRETVSILQKILPVGKDKDVIMVLDEAIGYLKSLKHKAQHLGVETV